MIAAFSRLMLRRRALLGRVSAGPRCLVSTSAPNMSEQPAMASVDQQHPLIMPTLSEESKEKVDAIFNRILWLDVIEVHLLTELINERLGLKLSDADHELVERVAMGGARSMSSAQPAAEAEEVVEEVAPTAFDIKLAAFDAKAKLKVIKEVRAVTGLGLKDAKEMVEGAPKVIMKDVKKEEAEELQKKLQDAGASIELV